MANSALFVPLFLLCHMILAKSFPQSQPDFHKLLSKSQLKKYFSVDEHEKVPEYNLVNIRMRRSSQTPIEKRSSNEPAEVEPSTDILIQTDSVFGHTVQLQLRRNNLLLAPSFKAVRVVDNEEQELPKGPGIVCHYVGYNGSIGAALSNCAAKGFSGMFLLPDGSVQVQPVEDDLAEILGLNAPQDKSSQFEEDVLHLVFKPNHKKRLSVPDEEWEDGHYIPSAPRSEYELDDDDIVKYLEFEDFDTDDSSSDKEKSKQSINKRKETPFASAKQLFMELAVFFDQSGYELFMPHLKSEEKLVDLLLGFVNQMQALYQQPALSKKVQISLVRLEVMKKQPSDLPHADGERDKLLDSFCSYQAKKNPASDSDPNHWDIALYISGLNFYSMEKGKKNGITMGLAPVGGVCMKEHSCVIAEFGTVSDDGRPYPSAGLLSTYVAAHEIGHNLGMFHDGPPNNDCPTNGHVMSPSRGTRGETTWSTCSSKVLEKSEKKCLFDAPQGSPSKGRDHSKYEEKPGQVWDAHDQCKIFLRDEDATLFNETVISMCSEWISASRAIREFMLTWKKMYPFFNVAETV